MNKLLLPPDQAGYNISFSSGVLRQQLDGGKGRYRTDILNSSNMVSVQWTLSKLNYEYLMAFYNIATSKAGEPFLLDLYMNKSDLQELQANFIPDSLKLNSQSGWTFTVSATLEVIPITDLESDQALIDLVTEYGDAQTVYIVLNLLAELVNKDLPEIA